VARKIPRPGPKGARSACPIANLLDVLGDKWTLLVVRDVMLLGRHRFGELAGSREGIPTNILTDRLRRLEEWGILEKRAYQERPTRHEYRLTKKGHELFPVIREMAIWSSRHMPGAAKMPSGFLEAAEKKLAAKRDS
jgi:DNA-binding HxlR family transcriptional regulator